jgi:hypothetical protein
MMGAATDILPVLLSSGPDDAIQLIEEHLFPIAEGIGEGRIENKSLNSKPNHQCTSCAPLCLLVYWRGVWLRSCFVDWMQTKEQSEQGGQSKNWKMLSIEIFAKVRIKLGASFRFQFNPQSNQRPFPRSNLGRI